MDETPRAFTARTSIAYAPPAWLVFHAAPLDPDATCPPLYRYPGPCGLADWFAGTMTLLGPPGPMLWLCERPAFHDTVGARHFGTLLLRSPLRYQAVPQRPRVWLAVNGPPEDVVWLPPSAVARRPAPPDERRWVVESLCRYLEELDAMRQTGAPGPGVPWCQVPAPRRLALLAEHGVAPVWTADPARRRTAVPWA
jgi:hypothetical protein